MTPLVIWLSATVVALGLVVWSGAARRRSLHYKLIVVMVACLCVAIWYAESYGKSLVFEGAAATLHTVHMISVALTFLCIPFLVVTGLRLARATGDTATSHRASHRKLAYGFVVIVVLTSALGIAMTAMAAPA
ncbi:MAG: hypothetical protein ACYTCU_00360 [Planctomycetota bacterium]|jgi:hypothetical protein